MNKNEPNLDTITNCAIFVWLLNIDGSRGNMIKATQDGALCVKETLDSLYNDHWHLLSIWIKIE